MTPLERLIDDRRTAWLLRCWYENEAYGAKAHAEIKAMAEVARRSLSQRLRFSAARIAANLRGGKK